MTDPDMEILSGWGRRPRSAAHVMRPGDRDLLRRAVSNGAVIPRGLGRSYGDAAQLSGGTVLDLTGLDHFRIESGQVVATGGASLAAIIDASVPQGWFLPATPGTRHVTVGGAVAADVHGKNHHRDGSLGSHVDEISLLSAGGEEVRALPGHGSFSATVGGMGLTGVVLEATFRLLRVETAWMRVDLLQRPDLASVMEALAEADRRSRYSVAWLDMLPGRRGRGVVQAADHASVEELPSRHRSRPLRRAPMKGLPAPSLPAGAVPAATGLFNRLYFSRSGHGVIEPMDTFFYPLDRLAGWNRLYGSPGFLQYQFAVPSGAEETLMTVAEALIGAPTPVSLAVLKRLGPGGTGILSFPIEGWTLSADMALGDPDLAEILDRCDRLVAEAGGRVYLAKDARLRPELVPVMYPRLDEWREEKARLDPESRFRSDLSHRLGLF